LFIVAPTPFTNGIGSGIERRSLYDRSATIGRVAIGPCRTRRIATSSPF
jgi:hypothetical protein